MRTTSALSHHHLPPDAERGAVAVFTAVAVSGLLAAGLLGVNAASLMAVDREVQRAADLSALAGAAATPLVGVLESSDPDATTCAVAAEQFAHAPVAMSLGSDAHPSCGNGVSVDRAADTALAERTREAFAALLATTPIDAPSLCDAPLPLAPAVDPWLLTLTATECAALQSALTGWPDRLAPAVLTPTVKVTVSGAFRAPIPLPGFSDSSAVTGEATARRRFKNVVVLPSVRWNAITSTFDALLPGEVGGVAGGVPMPLEDVNPNAEAAAARDVLLPALRDANAALAVTVGPFLPPGYDFTLDPLIRDAADVFDPPTQSAPSALDVATEAARTGDPVVLLRLFRMPVLGIPALDFTAAYLTPLAGGGFSATPIPVEQLTTARGLFGAALTR